MKTKLTIIIPLLFMVQWCLGQEQEFKPGDLIHSSADIEHKETNKNIKEVLDTVNFTPNFLEARTQFKIVKIDKDSSEYWLRAYPEFKELKCKKWWFFNGACKNDSLRIANAKKRKDKSFFYNNKIFRVSETEFLAKAEIAEQYQPTDRVSFGLLTLPFKFRLLDDKSFETNFNLNTTLNIQITQLWNAGFYTQLGAGIGNTNLYNSNAPGVAPNEEINVATLTLLSGVMLQYKKVQAGIYMGGTI